MLRMMKIVEEMKKRTDSLKNEITAIYYAYQNPKIRLLPKVMIIITLGYALSPIDLIPDFIPILGYLDDLIIIPTLITFSIKLIPEEIMAESRKKARQEPVQLKKNWFFAILFILTWIILIIVFLCAAAGLFIE